MKNFECVLAGMRQVDPKVIAAWSLQASDPYVYCQNDDACPEAALATLNGDFTSRQLRAIAAWMDEPRNIAAAYNEAIQAERNKT